MFGPELFGLREMSRELRLQLVVRFLAFLAPAGELGALTLEIVD